MFSIVSLVWKFLAFYIIRILFQISLHFWEWNYWNIHIYLKISGKNSFWRYLLLSGTKDHLLASAGEIPYRDKIVTPKQSLLKSQLETILIQITASIRKFLWFYGSELLAQKSMDMKIPKNFTRTAVVSFARFSKFSLVWCIRYAYRSFWKTI